VAVYQRDREHNPPSPMRDRGTLVMII